MDKLTEDAVQEIEQIHSSWIECEVAGDDQSMLALCADDIELRPPDAQPMLGRAAYARTRRVFRAVGARDYENSQH
jgi:ketosteroid isomerase-like protein